MSPQYTPHHLHKQEAWQIVNENEQEKRDVNEEAEPQGGTYYAVESAAAVQKPSWRGGKKWGYPAVIHEVGALDAKDNHWHWDGVVW